MYIIGNTLYFEGQIVGHVIIPAGSLRDRLETKLEEFEECNGQIDVAVKSRLARLNKALMNSIASAELTSR